MSDTQSLTRGNTPGRMSSTPPLRPYNSYTSNLIISIAVAALGTLQFGYHIAELNAPQQVLSCSEFSIPFEDTPYEDTYLGRHGLKQCIPLTNSQIGLITSIYSIGGLVGSFYAGRLADVYGRKMVSLVTSIVSIIGSIMLFYANSFWQLMLGRIIVGLACGIFVVITPLYINEVTPLKIRGAMGAMNQASINLGILLTQTLALHYTDSFRWRWLLFTGAILGILNLILWCRVYESPFWLALQGRTAGAEIALHHLRGGTYQDAKNELHEWLQQQRAAIQPTLTYDDNIEEQSRNTHQLNSDEEAPSLWKYITNPQYRNPRSVIAIILTAQQFVGINSIIFYGVKVVAQLLPDKAVPINFAISILNLIFTVAASAILDKAGRKPLLVASTSALSIASLGVSYAIVKTHTTLLVTSIFGYIIFFALGMGPIPFLIISELSQPQDKATAQSFGMILNWLATFFVGLLFPIIHDIMGGYVYVIFAVVGGFFVRYTQHNIPETKGKANYSDVWAGLR